MTQNRTWALLGALVLGLGVNGAPAQCPKEGCGKASICPSPTGSLIIGVGVNSDAGLTGSVHLNERNFDCTKWPYSLSGLSGNVTLNGQEFKVMQCPTAASSVGVCEQCPDCEACPGCYQKCPDCEDCCTKEQACPNCSAGQCAAKKGSFSIGLGITLLPGPLPLPVPIVTASATGAASAAAAPCCTPKACPPAAVGVYEPEGKEFIIETRLMEMQSGHQEHLLAFPRVMVLEGQPASVNISGNVVQAGQHGRPLPEQGMDNLLQVQVEELDSGNLLLDLTMQRNTVEKCNQHGTVVLCRRLASVQEVKPGKPTKLVLEKDDKGTARCWVEVTVKDASAKDDADNAQHSPRVPPPAYGTPAARAPEPLPPPRPMTYSIAAPPMPVTVFVPQPLPPLSPAEMMAPPPINVSAVPCPQPIGREIIPCNVPAVVTMPAANLASVFRAIKEDGHARLEVLQGPFARMTCPSMTWGTAGCKALKFTVAGERVHVSGDQLKAYANRVIADAEEHLVMEGQVRLTYTPVLDGGAQGAPRHIKADKVTIHLQDGHLDVEMLTKSKN